ncbi:MFS transporter [Pendulispora rubella]|uniref:MFS transporter n=1 Tax=Pendulispora rubella TaxID=2741070 RepID=A0ABZ2KXY2_9BACT
MSNETAVGEAEASGTENSFSLWASLAKYAVLYALLFLFGAEMYLVSPLLPTIAADLAIPITSAAGLVTAYVLIQALIGPVLGLGYAKWGARMLVTGGAVVFASANAIATFSSDYLVLVVVRALAGLGVALAGPAIWTWIAQTAAEEFRGTAIGAGMGSFAIGQVFGVPIGAFIAANMGWHASFGALALASACMLPFLWWKLRGADPSQQMKARLDLRAELRTLFSVWRVSGLRYTILVTFLFHAANLGGYTFLSDLLAQKHHLSVTSLGFIGLFSGMGMFVGSALGGRLGDRVRARGRTESLLLSAWIGVLLVTLALAICAPRLWLSLVAIGLWFTVAGAFDTNQQTLIAGMSAGFTAVALSWNMSILYAAAAFGVWIMSLGSDRATAVTVAATALLAIAFPASLWVAHRMKSAGT